jgi:integrase
LNSYGIGRYFRNTQKRKRMCCVMRYSNKGKPRGQARGLTKQQVLQVAAVVAQHPRNAALWAVAISSCLRSADLLALRVRDVTDSSGGVLGRFTANVAKTTNFHATSVRRTTVTCLLSPQARHLLGAYIAQAGLRGDARLFPLTTSRYRQLIKQWVSAIGLDPKLYSGHSSRRTLPSIVYAATKDIAACKELLSHSDLKNTHSYLSVNVDTAIDAAKKVMDW